jgi:hypothetical protein
MARTLLTDAELATTREVYTPKGPDWPHKRVIIQLLDHIDALNGLLADLTLDGRAAGMAERYRRALVKIAAYGDGEWGPHMDEPAAAYEARAALGDEPARSGDGHEW